MHGEGGAFDAGFLGVGRVEHLDGILVLLGPPDVHPHQHLGPVRGVHPAGAGTYREQRLTLVVFTREQRADLGGLYIGAQRLEFRVGLGESVGRLASVFFVGRQLVEHGQVLQALA